MTTTPRKKLIEVALPLEEINKASKKQKAPKGYPTSLHKYWAQRPLAACRAVIFAQLVDDPSAWPDRFPSPEAQAEERKRLHQLIARMVPWEASNNATILNEARYEIARSMAWARGEEPPTKPADVLAYLQQHAPPVYDPFCGGGSIPLEAQRLGLRAYGSDLNPVAVLISKALVEIPPKFAGQKPINPKARANKDLVGRQWKGAQGLAEDVRYYGRWMREQAEKRIGHLYPKAKLPDGGEATVIAWLWARTVRSPDPAAQGMHVPLASTFLLSTKEGKKAWVVPIVDRTNATYRFEIRSGTPSAEELSRAKSGTKSARGANFVCLITGSPIAGDWIKAEGKAGRLGTRLMAIVAQGNRQRVYLAPAEEHESIARQAQPDWVPSEPLANDPRNFWTAQYGLDTFGKLFTSRQLAALGTFSDLVTEARTEILKHAREAGISDDSQRLHEGGNRATAYADAVATYLAFFISRAVDYGSAISTWLADDNAIRGTFGRPTLPMTWDFCEGNYFGDSSAALETIGKTISAVIEQCVCANGGSVFQIDAPANSYPVRPVAVSTDPPYYDNVVYADLSDFFFVWLRRSLGERDDRPGVWPELFRRLLAPKSEELVASPYRHGGKDEAEEFFMAGMRKALKAMHDAADHLAPLAIYYAFKQSEGGQDGVTSAGWASFLQATVDSGLVVDGTWPLRTESAGRLVGNKTNALASSIVLVCRKRDPNARAIERDEFKRALRRELPDALAKIRAAGVGPVDMAQAAIGPGMGVFTRYSAVLEASGEAMKVKDALKLINEVRDEIEDEGEYDLETRFAVEWFAEAQWEAKESGRAILLANAKNLAEAQLERAGIIDAHAGKTRLRRRDEIGPAYNPDDDKTPTVWEHAQALAYALETGGQDAAAALLAKLSNTEAIRALAYRLYGLCERKGWSAEALVWNRLAEEWRRIEDLAASAPPREATREGDLFGGAA